MKKKSSDIRKFHSLTAQRFRNNLRENNINFDKKIVSQCVFLGFLKLKALPSAFLKKEVHEKVVYTPSKLKLSLRSHSNLKSGDKNANFDVRSEYKECFVRNNKNIVKVEHFDEKAEVKTYFTTKKLRLNPVRLVYHNMDPKNYKMEDFFKKEDPDGLCNEYTLQTTASDVNINLENSSEYSRTSSPILLDNFNDSDYCFRENIPEHLSEEEVSNILCINDEIQLQNGLEISENTINANTTYNFEVIDNTRKKTIKSYGNTCENTKKGLIMIRDEPNSVTLSVVNNSDILNLVENSEIRLTRSKSQSPFYCQKLIQIRPKCHSLSPERQTTVKNLRSRKIFETLKREASVRKITNSKIIKGRKNKNNDVFIICEKVKDNPVLVSSHLQSVELSDLNDSEVELSNVDNSPKKMVRSQRESVENMTNDDRIDIDSIKTEISNEQVQKSNFVLQNDDTQLSVKNLKNKIRLKQIQAELKNLSPAARLKKKTVLKNPISKEETVKIKGNVNKPNASESDSAATAVNHKRQMSIEIISNVEVSQPAKKRTRKPRPPNPVVGPTTVKKRKYVKRKARTDDIFANMTKEIEVTKIYSVENKNNKKNNDNNSDSDNDSRTEWCPEDYADYKRNFESGKQGKINKNVGKLFKCKICLMLFPSYYKLRKHDKVHLNRDKPYECTLCDQKFKDVMDLTAHIKIHKGKHPYQCRKCDKEFWEKEEFEVHQKVHVLKKERKLENKFRCDVCSKEFSKLCDMERHLRVHTGEKPCVCNICNKRFQQSHNLSKHLLTHLQVKPFHCEICNKKFGRIDVLNRHVMVHSIEKPFTCTLCNKGFIRLVQLEQHTKHKHPNLLEGAETLEAIEDPVE